MKVQASKRAVKYEEALNKKKQKRGYEKKGKIIAIEKITNEWKLEKRGKQR